jgi:hypothetical protein
MSRREDIVSCIDVTIMDRFAHRALPSPYSKIFPAFGAGAAVTPAAGLGGKRFIDFLEPHALTLDLSVPEQSYVEDCPVCCKPMVVSYTAVDGEVAEFSVESAE